MTLTRSLLPRTLLTGTLVGLTGTIAMDLLWYRRDGAKVGSFPSWEFSTGADSFDDVGAPAKVARRLASAFHQQIPDRHAGVANDVVHWATGLGWGLFAAGLAYLSPLPPVAAGVTAGISAFATSYAVLPLLRIYDPIWEYDAPTLWKDLSAHLVYGSASGLALAAVAGRE